MKIQLFAGQETSIARRGWYFRLLTAAQDVEVRITRSNDGKQFYKGALTSGLGIDFLSNSSAFGNAPFDTVYIKSEIDQLIDVWIEEVKADDDRLSGNFDINAALSVAATAPSSYESTVVNVSAGQSELLPFRANRRNALLHNFNDFPIFIGDDTNKMEVGARERFTWECQAALSVFSSGNRTIKIVEFFN